ncbi:MAG: PEP-CTERM sorting domain-containing protein [Verrucomicrobiota bacterium]|nr:PEP-CTERM sorting domain-containing protein [Verrucomicrobiota bacterium]
MSLRNGATSGGIIQLGGTNGYTTGTSIDSAGLTLVLGSDSALGTGTFTVNQTSTIQSSSARVVGNATVLKGDATIAGSNDITFTNSVTAAGAVTRTLTVNNTGLTTIQGNVYLSDLSGTGRTLVINGTGNTTISGVVSDFNGAGTAGTLSHGGSGTLRLNNTNTYSGGTLMSGGITIANADGALGTGNVSLTAASVTLTLQNGVVNNYLPDAGNFSIGFTNDTVNLNFTGASDIVNTFTLAGVGQAVGIYGGSGSGATFILPEFAGTGTITVLTAVPEPGTFVLMGMGAGALALLQRARRKRV